MCRSSPPTASGTSPPQTPLHSLRSSHFSRLGSYRSGTTVCPPAPTLDALEIQPCPCRPSTAVRSRSFLPSPPPIRQAAPHLKGGGPSPRRPARLPRARAASACLARDSVPKPPAPQRGRNQTYSQASQFHGPSPREEGGYAATALTRVLVLDAFSSLRYLLKVVGLSNGCRSSR